jgi:hypothetical protein
MIYPLSIRRENDYLASSFGYKQGHPWFQWRWGEDLTGVATVMDDFGKPVYDIHCACGVNKAIHTDPNCNWSTLAPQKKKVCIVPRYAQQWVMSVWGPAPEYGCYLPVGDPEKTLAILPDRQPSRGDTILVMMAVTEHYSKSAVERTKEFREKGKERWAVSSDKDPDKPMGTLQAQYYEMLKDSFPVGLKDEYGKTTQFHGQTGVGESPATSKLVIP